MNIQYVWIAIVIVGIVGGFEIGYAVSSFHNLNKMHGFDRYDGRMHGGYMMQDSESRHMMYSNMFDSTMYRKEMSEYFADHPDAMKSWCDTMMNNPRAMQMMHDMMGHGMGMMNQNQTQGNTGHW